MAQVIWLTGLSGSGKTTIAKKIYAKLKPETPNLVLLDGDEVRKMFGNDLGYDYNDRVKNAHRIQKLCSLLYAQNIDVICATMSMFNEIYQRNRETFSNYFEVYIYCDIKELKRRDKNGIYSKADQNVAQVKGINVAYDVPQNYDLLIDNTNIDSVDTYVDQIISKIKRDTHG